MAKYLSCVETAKLVRNTLKEAFPGVKFSVKSDTYSGGASIRVNWIDGPNVRQVDSVVKRFAGSYFDSMIDYKGSRLHMIDGQQVHLGADYVFTSREFSDELHGIAAERVFARYARELADAGIEKPTADDLRSGRLWNVPLPFYAGHNVANLQALLNGWLHKYTQCMKVEKSKTAGKVMLLGDDGYSRQCGSGAAAVDAGL